MKNSPNEEKSANWVPKSSVLAAFFGGMLALICCLTPAVAVLFGLGGGALALGLGRFQLLFVLLGAAILAGAIFWAIYRRNQCCTTKNRWKDVGMAMLILAAGGASFAAFNYVVIPIVASFSNRAAEVVVRSGSTRTINVNVEGMTCESCSVLIKQTLIRVPGVASVEIDFNKKTAVIEYDRRTISAEQILETDLGPQYHLHLRQGDTHENK